MDNPNAELSKHLHEVLDGVGASEFIRKKCFESAITSEIIDTFSSFHYLNDDSFKESIYRVGSRCEGTTTYDLHSDCDMIHCNEDVNVVEHLVNAKQLEESYLILTEGTKSGYVRLQYAKGKCLLYTKLNDISQDSRETVDRKGRICVPYPLLIDGLNTTRNGPADTVVAGFAVCATDMVYAVRCRQIPSSANSWLHRTREYDWPSKKQLKTMGSYGCFLVGVGHPHSEYKNIEWRISFTLQERVLMSSLNETQHKCYILLKMIKKDLIETKAGESLSSYHCKTSLFYTIENSCSHFWTNDKLIVCVQQCLKRLFIWVKAKCCPNYFIPEENMFDKISYITLKTLQIVLHDIISSDVTFLYSLTCEKVGERLRAKLGVSELESSYDHTKILFANNLIISNACCGYLGRNVLLQGIYCSFNTPTNYLNGVKQLLLYLQHTNHVTEHATSDVRMALDTIIPHIALQYKQCIFANILSRGKFSRQRYMPIQNIISETSDCDLISSKLVLASFYIQSVQLEEECKIILRACENSLGLLSPVISVCKCQRIGYHVYPDISETKRLTVMTSDYIREHYTTGCMVFHPYQIALLHTALQYEMFRTVFTKHCSEFRMKRDYWLDWITVDSQVYLHFLQYLLYSKDRNEPGKQTAVHKLMNALYKYKNLGHRETGFNILCWIFLQENELRNAWRRLCLSWRIRPFVNAAKWHMLIILRKVIKGKKGFHMVIARVSPLPT